MKAIEAELAKLNLGIEVELDEPLKQDPARDDCDPETGGIVGTFYRAYFLGYGRTNSGWGLIVKTYRYDRPNGREDERRVLEWGDRHPKRLADCSRELRMAAAEQIGELLTKLKVTATTKLAALHKVTDSK